MLRVAFVVAPRTENVRNESGKHSYPLRIGLYVLYHHTKPVSQADGISLLISIGIKGFCQLATTVNIGHGMIRRGTCAE